MTLTPLGAPPAAPQPKNVAEAAREFESLMLELMLQSARACGSGWLGEEDPAGSTMMELAEQHLARLIASRGGLGLAKLIEQGLAQRPSAKFVQP
jgi:Rod binding domain-containing protein